MINYTESPEQEEQKREGILTYTPAALHAYDSGKFL